MANTVLTGKFIALIYNIANIPEEVRLQGRGPGTAIKGRTPQ